MARDGGVDRVVITNSYLTRDEYELFRRLPGRQLVKHRGSEFMGALYAVDAYQEALGGLITVRARVPRARSAACLLGGVVTLRRTPWTSPTASNSPAGGLAGKIFDDIRRLT
jgi:hypothetical protein